LASLSDHAFQAGVIFQWKQPCLFDEIGEPVQASSQGIGIVRHAPHNNPTA
jgi:hypothetical protein